MNANGLLARGEGSRKVELRPTELVPSRLGDADFNPARDAFALRLGAEFAGPNRYRVDRDLLLDANGACRDPEECPECGSKHGEYRFFVRVEDPNAKPWEAIYTHCSRCCSAAEKAERER